MYNNLFESVKSAPDHLPRQVPSPVVSIPPTAKIPELSVLVKLLAAFPSGQIVRRAVDLETAALANQTGQRALYDGITEHSIETRDATEEVVRVPKHVNMLYG